MSFVVTSRSQPPLTLEKIRKLSQGLSKPFRKFSIDGTVFEIFKAKELYAAEWLNPALSALVKEARRTYLHYGDVPLIDNYDKKAAIYLCRVRYRSTVPGSKKSFLAEEWLSTRFIPGNGQPFSTEDLDQYLYRRKKAGVWMQKKFFRGDRYFLKKIITISRICGISRYAVAASNQSRVVTLPLRYTAISFILMNHVFLTEDAPAGVTYLTAVFRKRLLDKILNATKENAMRSLFFSSAHQLFGCRPGDIVLDRRVMAYRFPGYFLNLTQLVGLIKRLFRKNKVSLLTLRRHLKNFTPEVFDVIDDLHYTEVLRYFDGVGKMLSHRGVLPGSKLTGAALRKLVDREIDDGPQLKIMNADKWKRQLHAFMALVKQNNGRPRRSRLLTIAE